MYFRIDFYTLYETYNTYDLYHVKFAKIFYRLCYIKHYRHM